MTRYLFYNSKGAVSPIVPNNLRSLRHLIGMLYDMKDVYKAEEPEIGNEGEQDQGANNAPEPAEVSFDNIIENRPDIDKAVLESNKRLFKNYFYNTWVKQLSVENQLLAYKDGRRIKCGTIHYNEFLDEDHDFATLYSAFSEL